MAMKDRIAQSSTTAAAGAFRRPSGRASYPRRKTVDLSDEQSQWLDETVYERRISGVGLIRAALDHLATHPDVLDQVAAAAHATEHPDQH